jgi:hypothetical protein
MSNYCRSCSKLVGLETNEPEIENEDLSEGNISVEVRLVRACADCSDEMKEYRFELEEDVSEKIEEHNKEKHGTKECSNCDGAGTEDCTKCGATGSITDEETATDSVCDECDGQKQIDCSECSGSGEQDNDDAPDYSLEVEAENTDRTQTKDRHGKPILRSRYMKTFYGVSVKYTVTCDDCSDVVAEGTIEDEAQASSFDELN